jgi:ubiquinone/menaquinone biosynthesis C-methylase UbiE
VASHAYDYVPTMKAQSLWVRSLVEKVLPPSDEDRVLEVGSGAHGLIFFFGARTAVGIDPLAFEYAGLFPAWQRRVRTASALGEALPFRDSFFDVVLSDNVVDHAEDPEAILSEIARVLVLSGAFFFTVHVSHPAYGIFSFLYKVWRAVGGRLKVADFVNHTRHFSLSGARRLLRKAPLRVVSEKNTISEARRAIWKRPKRRLGAWIQGFLYYQAEFQALAIREQQAEKHR